MEPTNDGNTSDTNDSDGDSISTPINEDIEMETNINDINDNNDINVNFVNSTHTITLLDAELVRRNVSQISEMRQIL